MNIFKKVSKWLNKQKISTETKALIADKVCYLVERELKGKLATELIAAITSNLRKIIVDSL